MATVDQIEPYPRDAELLSALPSHWTLHETTLQRAPLAVFDALESGDVCFFDGSHVARAASDVVWFFFEVLPRLRPGVVVHIHDVFWPSDYPDQWIFERGQTWNEQYVLQAFLMYNERFAPLICNAALVQLRAETLDELYRETGVGSNGVSAWLVRRPRTPAALLREVAGEASDRRPAHDEERDRGYEDPRSVAPLSSPCSLPAGQRARVDVGVRVALHPGNTDTTVSGRHRSTPPGPVSPQPPETLR